VFRSFFVCFSFLFHWWHFFRLLFLLPTLAAANELGFLPATRVHRSHQTQRHALSMKMANRKRFHMVLSAFTLVVEILYFLMTKGESVRAGIALGKCKRVRAWSIATERNVITPKIVKITCLAWRAHKVGCRGEKNIHNCSGMSMRLTASKCKGFHVCIGIGTPRVTPASTGRDADATIIGLVRLMSLAPLL